MVIYRILALYQIQFQTMDRINIVPSFTKTTLKACHLCVVRSPKVHDDLLLSLNVCNNEKEYLEFFTCQHQLELIFSSPCFSRLWLLNILNMSNIHGAYSKILSRCLKPELIRKPVCVLCFAQTLIPMRNLSL